MDDLSGLEWASRPKSANNNQAYRGSPPAPLTVLQPTSHSSVPSRSGTQSPANSGKEKKAPANDGFSSLVSFTSTSSTKNLSLQEQQKLLQEQKTHQQAAKKQQFDSLYNGGDEHFWNKLGSGRGTPATTSSPGQHKGDLLNGALSPQSKAEDHDILAAFNADAPVDSSSYFPKPSEPVLATSYVGPRDTSPLPSSHSLSQPPVPKDQTALDDDDPFGLAELPPQGFSNRQEATTQKADDDDVLGLLGKPASEFPNPQSAAYLSQVPMEKSLGHPQDKALAELMEMGFSAENAQQALKSTGSGTDIQQAVSYLLNKAHAEARTKTAREQASRHPQSQDEDDRSRTRGGSKSRIERPEPHNPVWSKKSSRDARNQARATAVSNQSEIDPAQVTSEFGNNLLKTAGTFWKTSSKKVQQVVQDFNSDSDSSQPKWMRDPSTSRGGPKDDRGTANRGQRSSNLQNAAEKQQQSVTDEAMLLESDRPAMPPRKPRGRQDGSLDPVARTSSSDSPARTAFNHQHKSSPTTKPDPRIALNRQAIEEQASQAYVSSSRRRRLGPKPSNFASERDLLETPSRPEPPLGSTERRPTQAKYENLPQRPAAVRPAIPCRNVPSISPAALRASHASREAGNNQFKRGDYSGAQESYSISLGHLPADHPITVILHTNRALTSLKIGDPKTAISDSEKAFGVIGSSGGESEVIDLVNGDPAKPMRDYFGKALMRKAEALEQIEKWREAAAVWREAVERGHGGAASIQGRIRCEKAASPQRPRRTTPKPAKTLDATRRSPSSASEPNRLANHHPPAVAVNQLRAANAAADRVDDEKFALADTIDARLAAWKGGKADNLRALLGSLDTILWPEAGWKKIGMAELVLPSKVKVQYMKGIGKVHPDKLPPTASTEQRMIAGAVFSTLNEAWDKFKRENGL